MRYVTGEDSSRRGREWEWLLTREGEGSDNPPKRRRAGWKTGENRRAGWKAGENRRVGGFCLGTEGFEDWRKGMKGGSLAWY